MILATLQAEAAALKASNRAKYKALGQTHRGEVHAFFKNGKVKEVHVFYTALSETYTEDAFSSRLVIAAIKAGTASVGRSFESIVIEAL